jgi:hypothetical protein
MATNPPKRQAPKLQRLVIRWLFDSDPSIRWQVMRSRTVPGTAFRPNSYQVPEGLFSALEIATCSVLTKLVKEFGRASSVPERSKGPIPLTYVRVQGMYHSREGFLDGMSMAPPCTRAKRGGEALYLSLRSGTGHVPLEGRVP